MAITNTWAIVQMDCYPQADGEKDVVFNAHWQCVGTDGTYQGYVYGSQSLPAPTGSDFTPYAELTQDQVVGWVKTALGEEQVATYETNVAKQIADQVKPPVATPPLPWSAQA